MDKIKELWDKLVAWAQGNPAVAGVAGLVLIGAGWFLVKRAKRRKAQRRAAARARRGKRRKRSRK